MLPYVTLFLVLFSIKQQQLTDLKKKKFLQIFKLTAREILVSLLSTMS